MSPGILYSIARWLESHRLTRRIVLKFHRVGPTGKRLYLNRIDRVVIMEREDWK